MTESWTSLRLIQWTSSYFEKKGVPNPRLDSELLLAHVLKCSRIALYTDHEKTVSDKHLARFKELIERRAKREPLQYILGETEFWGLRFKVTPEVLIPRPETELLIEESLKAVGANLVFARDRAMTSIAPTILDIGTGSGCIAIALAKHLSESRVVATDVSKEALELARRNAEAHQVADRVEFTLVDIAPWKAFQAAGRLFDLIVSNPPYIATAKLDSLQAEVRDHEPRAALNGGAEGLDIVTRILEEAPAFLSPGGTLLMEVGEGQAKALYERITETRKDYNGAERILILKKARNPTTDSAS